MTIIFDYINLSPWPILIYNLYYYVCLQNKYGAHILNSFDFIIILVRKILYQIWDIGYFSDENFHCIKSETNHQWGVLFSHCLKYETNHQSGTY